MNLFPLSVGSLKADGLLCVALGLSEDSSKNRLCYGLNILCRYLLILYGLLRVLLRLEEPLCRYLSKWYEIEKNSRSLSNLFNPLLPPPPAPANPKVKVFYANRGDSTLFSWNTWNILIDGGLTYAQANPPCFCNEIRKLNKLDLVVLTHGDADHINGLLPFFKKMSNDKNNPPFIGSAAFLHHGMKLSGERGWSAAIELIQICHTS